jgi:hypothetical protein
MEKDPKSLKLAATFIKFPVSGLIFLVSAPLLWAQETTASQTFTLYPPSVYMQLFLACSGGGPCARTEKFKVTSRPKGCCILTVTNGDGRGSSEVSSYEVFLNDQKVLLSDTRNSQAPVKILKNNRLKVVLTGPPSSKVFILIAYDPRKL